jgi:Fe-S cluster assembly ATPase SufC
MHGRIQVSFRQAELGMDVAFARRYLNEGFSGDEKKRMALWLKSRALNRILFERRSLLPLRRGEFLLQLK